MHPMHKATPSNRLRQVRAQRGIKRTEVAAACVVDTSTVARWENGGEIPWDKLGTVGRLLDVSVPYLIGWSSTDEPYTEPDQEAA